MIVRSDGRIGMPNSDKPSKKGIYSKKCIACKNYIPKEANICQGCGSYQNIIKNELKYLANIAAIFAVIGAALAYLINTAPSIKKVLFWNDDIRVISLNTDDKITIGNYGDGDVYLDHLHIHVKSERKNQIHLRKIEINDVLSPGKFLTKDIKEFEKRTKKHFTILPLPEMNDEELHEELYAALDNAECYSLSFHVESDASYKIFNAIAHNDLHPIEVLSIISFYSEHDPEIKMQGVPLKAQVFRIDDPSCDHEPGNEPHKDKPALNRI
jgi:hypothetical protein